ncbi:transport and Golgi organization protein 1 homolog isoform X2 [Patella vulgata]|uniref:transport and Golgi organization protein 1 homolog isoform X2 n=1 Tax=Patella vulgata TaxID=6465 RepID=UPI0024A8822B|nr:transport and Golgi organization protein 1 homolog isoform X2 [Patella vulgata]
MAATCKVRTQVAFILLFLSISHVFTSKISDARLCADRDCQETISKAQALANHNSNDPMYLSFRRGDVILIKSKSAGNRPDLWSGELNGIRGYFPYAFVREFEVMHRKLDYETGTEKHYTPGELALQKGGQKAADDEEENEEDDNETDENTEEIQEKQNQKVPESVENTKQEEKVTQENVEVKESAVPEDKTVQENVVPATENVVNMKVENIDKDETEVSDEPDDNIPLQTNTEVKEILVPQAEDRQQKDETELDETEVDETEVKEEVVEKPVVDAHAPSSADKPAVQQQAQVPEQQQVKETEVADTKDDTEIDETEIPDEEPTGDTVEDDSGWSLSNLNKYLKNTFSGGKVEETKEDPPQQQPPNPEQKEKSPTEQPAQLDTKQEINSNFHENKATEDIAQEKIAQKETHKEVDETVEETDLDEERDDMDERFDEDEDSTEIADDDDEEVQEETVKDDLYFKGKDKPSQATNQKQPTEQQEVTPAANQAQVNQFSQETDKVLSEQPPFGKKPVLPTPDELLQQAVAAQKQAQAKPKPEEAEKPVHKTETLVNIDKPRAENGPPTETNTVIDITPPQNTITIQKVPTESSAPAHQSVVNAPHEPLQAATPQNKQSVNVEPLIQATPVSVQQLSTEVLHSKNQDETSQIVIDGTTINLNDDYDNTLLYSSSNLGFSNSIQQESPVFAKTEELGHPSHKVEAVVSSQTIEKPVTESVGIPAEGVVNLAETAGLSESSVVIEDAPLEEPVANLTEPVQEQPNIPLEPEILSSTYQSDDYLSRKPLAVNNGQNTRTPQVTHHDEPVVTETPQTPEATTDGHVAEEEGTTLPTVVGELVPPPIEEPETTQPQEEVTKPREKYDGEDVYSYEDFPSPSDTSDSFADVPKEEEITSDTDPYKTDSVSSRKITDENLEDDSFGSPVKRNGFADRITRPIIALMPASLQSFLEKEPLGMSPALMVIMTISSIVLLIVTTCCSSSGVVTGKKVAKAVVVVKNLEDKLFIATKEKESLEDALEEAQKEIKKYEKQLSSQQSVSGKSKANIQNLQFHNDALKQQVNSLQKQIDEYEFEVKETKGSSLDKDKRVKELEKQVHKLEERAKKAEKNLEKKTQEMQDNIEEVATKTSQMKSLSDQVQHLETRKQQLLSEAADWKEKVDDLNERLSQTEEEFKQMQETVAFKDREFEVLRECFVQLKAFENEKEMEEEPSDESGAVHDKLQTMIDVAKVNASLRTVQEDRDTLENKLQIETEARQEVEEQLDKLRREMESFQADKMKAERQFQESQTKLNVLSNYFKEKEMQLQKELGEQEVLKKQNINKLVNADEKSKQTEEERAMYKQQVESLKRELEAADRDFRAQIAANEQKAHENWLAARAAERELKESRHQNTTLRQRLTELTRKPGPEGLIRPLPTRGMPPPGMMNGPPMHLPPGMDRPPVERSPSRGSIPPHHPPRDEFYGSPHERLPHPDRRLPPGPRLPPPHNGRSPPPFDRRPPPPHLDRRTPPYRPPHPDMMPPFRGPPPPRDGPTSPLPLGPPGYDPRLGPRASSPYMRPPPPGREKTPRQQSQV